MKRTRKNERVIWVKGAVAGNIFPRLIFVFALSVRGLDHLGAWNRLLRRVVSLTYFKTQASCQLPCKPLQKWLPLVQIYMQQWFTVMNAASFYLLLCQPWNALKRCILKVSKKLGQYDALKSTIIDSKIVASFHIQPQWDWIWPVMQVDSSFQDLHNSSYHTEPLLRSELSYLLVDICLFIGTVSEYEWTVIPCRYSSKSRCNGIHLVICFALFFHPSHSFLVSNSVISSLHSRELFRHFSP